MPSRGQADRDDDPNRQRPTEERGSRNGSMDLCAIALPGSLPLPSCSTPCGILLDAQPLHGAPMLTAQQAVAKEAAHRQFDNPTRFAAERHGDYRGRDKVARFRPGVEGIGIAGPRLRIYVREDLAANLEIPSRFEGLLTQRVLTTGFCGFVAPRQARLSPAQCGVSVGHPAGKTGTLGCLIDTPGGRCVLSNNHILAIANAAQIGDGILQPGTADARPNERARIATLTAFEPLRFGSAVNRMDAAIAALDDANSAVPNIMTMVRRPTHPSPLS